MTSIGAQVPPNARRARLSQDREACWLKKQKSMAIWILLFRIPKLALAKQINRPCSVRNGVNWRSSAAERQACTFFTRSRGLLAEKAKVNGDMDLAISYSKPCAGKAASCFNAFNEIASTGAQLLPNARRARLSLDREACLLKKQKSMAIWILLFWTPNLALAKRIYRLYSPRNGVNWRSDAAERQTCTSFTT